MATQPRPDWQVRVYGNRIEQPDIDLTTQLVIMLGRELRDAVNADHKKEEL